MRTRTIVATVAATGLLLIGGGTALALGSGSGSAGSAVVPAAVVAHEQPAAQGAPQPAVDRAAAERIALERAGAGRVTEVEFDRADHDDDDG